MTCGVTLRKIPAFLALPASNFQNACRVMQLPRAVTNKYRLTLPGAPQTAHYTNTGCSPNQPNALTTTMGLSIGWGDSYPSTTNLQWIDITGLPNGKYRLFATADPGHVVQESSYSNNGAWATVKIAQDRVTVIKYGPGA